MISFRYHVISLVAVLLALAAGVALGGGPLSEIGRGDDAAQRAEERAAELDDRLDEADQTESFQDAFAGAVSARSVGGSLTGRPVVLLTMPGADAEVVDALGELVEQAGGSLAGEYAVLPKLVDQQEKSLVDTLGSQLIETVRGTGVDAGAPTYARIGGLISVAIATGDDGGGSKGDGAREILSSLKSAELLTQREGGDAKGSTVLVVLGDEPADLDQDDAVYAGLLNGLTTSSDGVLVAGTTASAADGLLAALRDDVTVAANVSSVDSVQTAAGRVAAVLALASDARGSVGHYGATGLDGALPRG